MLEEYRAFLKQIEKLYYRSCFLLIGWEQPREFPQITSENSPIQTLQLMGLDIESSAGILKDHGLGEIDRYTYSGLSRQPFMVKKRGDYHSIVGSKYH